MLFHTPAKALALVGMLSFATTAHAAVECPRSVQGHRLTAFSLFEGDPARQVELAPGSVPGPNGSYVNTWPLRSSVGLVAVCRFDGAAEQRITLPSSFTSCRAEGGPRQLQASCR